MARADRTPSAGPDLRGRPARGMQTRTGPPLIIVVALLLVGLIVAMILWATLGPEDEDAASSTTLAGTTAATAPPPAVSAIAAVAAYDPAGNGEENDDLAASLAEGGGTWQTVCYASEFMGKPGVGLVVSLAEAGPGTLSFAVANAPYQIDVFATADEAVPAAIDDWGNAVGDRHFAEDPNTVTVPIAEPVRHLLVLFREIGPDPECSSENPYRGAIGDITFTP